MQGMKRTKRTGSPHRAWCRFQGSGFVGRRFSDDSLTGLVPNDFPAVLAGEAPRRMGCTL